VTAAPECGLLRPTQTAAADARHVDAGRALMAGHRSKNSIQASEL
jgi:hypothetical protein